MIPISKATITHPNGDVSVFHLVSERDGWNRWYRFRNVNNYEGVVPATTKYKDALSAQGALEAAYPSPCSIEFGNP